MPLQITYAFIMIFGCLYIFIAYAKINTNSSMHAGRYAALLIAGSAIAFCAIDTGHNWQDTAQTILWIDLVCGAAFAALAMRYPSRWIMRCGGLQLAKISTHLATIITPDFGPALYRVLLETWMILILAAAVSGVWAERRRSR